VKRDAGIGHSAGHDELRVLLQGCNHRHRTEVGVGARYPFDHFAEPSSVVHVRQVDAIVVPRADVGEQIVAGDDTDAGIEPFRLRDRGDRPATRFGPHPAGIGDDRHVIVDREFHDVVELAHEVSGKPSRRVPIDLLLQNRHRDLGKEVHRDYVDRPAFELAAQRREVVAPIAAGICDSQWCDGCSRGVGHSAFFRSGRIGPDQRLCGGADAL